MSVPGQPPRVARQVEGSRTCLQIFDESVEIDNAGIDDVRPIEEHRVTASTTPSDSGPRPMKLPVWVYKHSSLISRLILFGVYMIKMARYLGFHPQICQKPKHVVRR